MSTILKIEDLRVDGGTQPRAAIDFEAVDDYAQAMAEGATFPPVVVFYDGAVYWLADGFHRVKAAFAAGRDEIACEMHQGTQQDAQWFSFGANRTNGLRRTNDDKQRAVKAALTHPKSQGLSDRQIARHCGVSDRMVNAYREHLEASAKLSQMPVRTVTRGGSTYPLNTANIGRQTPAATPQAPPSIPPESIQTARPTPAPLKGAGKLGAASTEDDLATEWCQRVYRACLALTECQLTAKDLAAAIRRSDSRDQILKQLETAREFIASVLIEAGLV